MVTPKILAIAVSLFGLGACPGWAQESKFVLIPNSPERLEACSPLYHPHSKALVDCWRGEILLPSEFCALGRRALQHAWLTDWDKAQVFETMKSRGCMR